MSARSDSTHRWCWVEGEVDRIERVITITGALDAQQRQRLLAIADKCPVHRTLHSEVPVVMREADNDAAG
jgi:uncharacterized OsmC-like protein